MSAALSTAGTSLAFNAYSENSLGKAAGATFNRKGVRSIGKSALAAGASTYISSQLVPKLDTGASYMDVGVHGLDVCENLPLFLKKILLTGKFSAKEAIDYRGELFSDYIQKGHDPKILDDLQNKISKNNDSYYLSISDALKEYIKLHKINSLLFSDDYINYVKQIISKHNIQHYCAIDTMGSYLLSSADKQYLIYVQSEGHMDSTVDEYKDLDSSNIKEKLASYKYIPTIIDQNYNVIYPEDNEIFNNLYSVDKVINYNGINYYICLIKL